MQDCDVGMQLLDLRRELALRGKFVLSKFHANNDKQRVRERIPARAWPPAVEAEDRVRRRSTPVPILVDRGRRLVFEAPKLPSHRMGGLRPPLLDPSAGRVASVATPASRAPATGKVGQPSLKSLQTSRALDSLS